MACAMVGRFSVLFSVGFDGVGFVQLDEVLSFASPKKPFDLNVRKRPFMRIPALTAFVHPAHQKATAPHFPFLRIHAPTGLVNPFTLACECYAPPCRRLASI